MTTGLVAVFGGTGFLGRRIVRHLRNREYSVRIASRHPERDQRLFGTDDPHIQSVEADVRDEQSVAAAIAGTDAVVNAVSLYVEHGHETFHSVHVQGAERLAAQAQGAGVKHLVHLSGIGADPRSRSLYIRKRGAGELAIRFAFPNAIVIRPAVMFGPDDAFLTTILSLLRRLPIYPMFGSGLTRLQPAYVGDVAEAVVRTMQVGAMTVCSHQRVSPCPDMAQQWGRFDNVPQRLRIACRRDCGQSYGNGWLCFPLAGRTFLGTPIDPSLGIASYPAGRSGRPRTVLNHSLGRSGHAP
jgi:uncharacterized protein YbjT (DUF2867 family)